MFLCFPNRGKGDYFRLGHGTDVHVRKPQMVEGLRGKKIVHVAVGALHCLAVTDTGQVRTEGHTVQPLSITAMATLQRSKCIRSTLADTSDLCCIIPSVRTNLIMLAHLALSDVRQILSLAT